MKMDVEQITLVEKLTRISPREDVGDGAVISR